MSLLLVDHYDSFTYNLKQLMMSFDVAVKVMKCDDMALVAEGEKASHVIFSPGPGNVYHAADIGQSAILLQNIWGKVPLLGVCLGHQLIAHHLGARIIPLEPFHGKQMTMQLCQHEGLFRGLGPSLQGMRYHSQGINPQGALLLQKEGWVSAVSKEDHQVMALEKPSEKVFGVQFHPESIGTPQGTKIMENFLRFSRQ